jgi:short-subunit dehydrogenase
MMSGISWAVVLGASEGIGAAFARLLAERGYALILVARREEPLQALAAELRARHGHAVEVRALDLAAADLEAQLRVLATSYQVETLIYNAALSIVAPFLETPISDKQRILDINVRGPMIAAHVFGEPMAARGKGTIVLMSSLTAFWGSPWVATYGATKAFNLSLGEALAVELKARGVDVIVCTAGATSTPGFVATTANTTPPASMTPEAVARQTLARVRRGLFVPGVLNRFAQWFLTRLLPRRTAVGIMGGQTSKLLRR